MTTDEVQLVRDAFNLVEKFLLGVFGGVFALTGAYLAHHFSKEREREKLLQEKAERLAEEIFALDDWLENAASRKNVYSIVPPGRVHALSTLYFPSLGKELGELYGSLVPLMDHVNTGDRQNEGSWRNSYNELHAEFRRASLDFIEAISNYVTKKS